LPNRYAGSDWVKGLPTRDYLRPFSTLDVVQWYRPLKDKRPAPSKLVEHSSTNSEESSN